MEYYFYNSDNKLTCNVPDTFDRLDDWKATNHGFILQEALLNNKGKARSCSELKIVNGVVTLKTDEDFRQDRISVAERSKDDLYLACKSYQEKGAKPRIDSNFFALLIQSQGIKNLNPAFTCPCCDENIAWNNTLWSDYDQRKVDIDNGDIPNNDFSNNGNPPHTWDECFSELQ